MIPSSFDVNAISAPLLGAQFGDTNKRFPEMDDDFCFNDDNPFAPVVSDNMNATYMRGIRQTLTQLRCRSNDPFQSFTLATDNTEVCDRSSTDSSVVRSYTVDPKSKIPLYKVFPIFRRMIGTCNTMVKQHEVLKLMQDDDEYKLMMQTHRCDIKKETIRIRSRLHRRREYLKRKGLNDREIARHNGNILTTSQHIPTHNGAVAKVLRPMVCIESQLQSVDIDNIELENWVVKAMTQLDILAAKRSGQKRSKQRFASKGAHHDPETICLEIENSFPPLKDNGPLRQRVEDCLKALMSKGMVRTKGGKFMRTNHQETEPDGTAVESLQSDSRQRIIPLHMSAEQKTEVWQHVLREFPDYYTMGFDPDFMQADLCRVFEEQTQQYGPEFDSSSLIMAGADVLLKEARTMTEDQQVDGLKLMHEYIFSKHGYGIYGFFLTGYIRDREDAQLNSEAMFEKLAMARMVCMYELLNSRLALFNNIIQMN